MISLKSDIYNQKCCIAFFLQALYRLMIFFLSYSWKQTLLFSTFVRHNSSLYCSDCENWIVYSSKLVTGVQVQGKFNFYSWFIQIIKRKLSSPSDKNILKNDLHSTNYCSSEVTSRHHKKCIKFSMHFSLLKNEVYTLEI